MHACRLNQTGKLSVREVYHAHENDDHDHDFMPDIYWPHKLDRAFINIAFVCWSGFVPVQLWTMVI
jgi:hypothetical protein